MKKINKGNKVFQYKLLLNEIKMRLKPDEHKSYGAMYYFGRIEVSEFCDIKFVMNESNYKTYSYSFTKVPEALYEDLMQAWYEVFGTEIPLQIVD